MTDEEMFNAQARIGNAILSKANATQQTGDVVTAMNTLYERIVSSGNTLLLLHSTAKHDCTCDAVSILRTIYDTSLQALYIFHDPQQRNDLARRYIDFGIVEKWKMIKIIDEQATDFSKQLSQSEKRAAVESEIQTEYQRVCRLYNFRDPEKPPRNWYKGGSLKDIAKTVKYEEEYELLQKQLSGVVHSSFHGLQGISIFNVSYVVALYWRFAFRVLGKLAEHVAIDLDETERGLIDQSNANLYDR